VIGCTAWIMHRSAVNAVRAEWTGR